MLMEPSSRRILIKASRTISQNNPLWCAGRTKIRTRIRLRNRLSKRMFSQVKWKRKQKSRTKIYKLIQRRKSRIARKLW